MDEDGKSYIKANTLILIPAFNEEHTIVSIISQLSLHFQHILVVDDSSTDQTFNKIKSLKSCKALRHCVNCGQGTAILTGVKYFLDETDLSQVVTFDADGQHKVTDAIELAINFYVNKYDALFASRFLKEGKSTVPFNRFILLKSAVIFEKLFFGLKLTDSHNGLRVLSRKACKLISSITSSRMAHATEIPFLLKRNNIKIFEYPCEINYLSTKESASPLSGLNIISELIQKK